MKHNRSANIFFKFLLLVYTCTLFFLFLFLSGFFIPNVGAILYPMHTAVRYEWTPVIKLLSLTPLIEQERIGFKGGCTRPLELAARSGRIKSVGVLIDSGAELFGCRYGVVHASLSHPETLKYVIEDKGIDPDLRREPNGAPAIFKAISCHKGKSRQNSLESLEILLTHGANPNNSIEKNEKAKGTPLYRAAINHCPEPIKLLLEHGADPVPVEDALHQHFSNFEGYIKPSEIEGLKASIRLIKRAAEIKTGLIIRKEHITSWTQNNMDFSLKLTDDGIENISNFTKNNVGNTAQVFIEDLQVMTLKVTEHINGQTMFLSTNRKLNEEIIVRLPKKNNTQDFP